MHKSKIGISQIMKKYTSLALIGAIVAGITGFVSLDAISAPSLMIMQGTSDMHETGLMIGHVTYEVRGMDGQIKHYFQSDNIIVDKGTDCAAVAIFDTADGSSVCSLGNNGGFAFIAIGNSTTPYPLSTAEDEALDVDTDGNGEMQRLLGTVTITSADTVGTGADTTVSIVSPQFSFDNSGLGAAGTKITQSGLFDSDTAGTNNMFSARDVPPIGTGLLVTSVDKLSITWTITLASPT